MTIIHMDTETARSLVTKIQNGADYFSDSLNGLSQRCHQMEWSGFSRDAFLEEVSVQQNKIKASIEELQNLAFHLQQEIAQWEGEAESFKNGSYLSDNNSIASVFTAAFSDFRNSILAGIGSIFGNKTLEEKFDFLENDESANTFQQEMIDANLTFVLIDEDGNQVDTFGAENGTIVEVKWQAYEDGSTEGGGIIQVHRQ